MKNNETDRVIKKRLDYTDHGESKGKRNALTFYQKAAYPSIFIPTLNIAMLMQSQIYLGTHLYIIL